MFIQIKTSWKEYILKYCLFDVFLACDERGFNAHKVVFCFDLDIVCVDVQNSFQQIFSMCVVVKSFDIVVRFLESTIDNLMALFNDLV